MAKLTKAARQEIVREFATRHNGRFNPTLFVDEVRQKGPSHPAYGWFEWNRDTAARQWQIEQARDFARDLRVAFTVEAIGAGRRIVVRQAEMPLVLSPMEGRRSGGGYVLTDETDPEHMAEHCRQAAGALRAWLNRYAAAVHHAGGSVATVEGVVTQLEEAAPREPAAA